MASGDHMVDGYISSLLVDSLKSNPNGDDLSPEDITWADSLLVKDPDISDGDWSSMKDALIEILGLQHDYVASNNSVAPTTDDFSGGTDVEMLQSAKPKIVKFSRRTNVDSVFVPMNNDEMETANDEFPVEEDEYSLSEHFQDLSENSLRNVFLPNYKEDIQEMQEPMSSGNDDTASIQVNNEEMETANDEFPVEEAEFSFQGDVSETLLANAFLPNYREDIQEVQETMSSQNDAFSSSTYEIEPSTQEIFKVWDLGIQPEEEDELIKQLNKVLSETPDQSVAPPTINDSRTYKDLKEQSLDDLITGLADLSLNQHSN